MRISRFPSITFLCNGQFCLSYLSLRYEGKWEVVVFVNSTGLISNKRAGNPMVRSEKCLHLSAYVCICLYKHVTGDHYFRVWPFVWFSMRLFHHCLSAMSNVKLASLPIHPLLTIFFSIQIVRGKCAYPIGDIVDTELGIKISTGCLSRPVPHSPFCLEHSQLVHRKKDGTA